jgi:transposase
MLLMPVSLEEWLPEDHLAWFILDAVGQMDLTPFYQKYREDGSGNAAFEPNMMVALLLYAYSQGMRSSRIIEKKCKEDVAYRIIAANQFPDHSTIARFRQTHEAQIQHMFVEMLRLCREAGLGNLGIIAVDGTKIAANAALAANRTREGLEKEVQKILKEAEAIDAREDRKYGSNRSGNELPEGLRNKSSRLARLQEAQRRLEQEACEATESQASKIEARNRSEAKTGRKRRGRKPRSPESVVDTGAKANTTDPESRIMKTRSGYVQGYNAQVVVSQDQIILATNVVQDENDQHQLFPMMQLLKKNLKSSGRRNTVKTVLGDAGYANEAILRRVNRGSQEVLLATTKDWRRRRQIQEEGIPKGRIPMEMTLRERMERKLRTKRGHNLYRQRGMIVEAVIGQIKTCIGCRYFMRRGQQGGQSEWQLACTVHNLMKLYRSGKAHWC